jgi:hypothetical protein
VSVGATTIGDSGAFNPSGAGPLASTSHTLKVLINGTEVTDLTKTKDCTPTPPEPEASSALDCVTGWSVSLEHFAKGTTVDVLLDGVSVGATTIGDSGAFNPSGAGPLASTSHTLKVLINGTEVTNLTKSKECTTPTKTVEGSLTCSVWSVTFTNWVEERYFVEIDGVQVATGTTSSSPQTIGGTTGWTTGTHSMTVLSSTEERTVAFGPTSPIDCSPPPPPPPGPACTILSCLPSEEPVPVVEPAAAVVPEEPAVVTVPEPATIPVAVPKPAKKPAAVPVAVPEKGTIPTAVNAGGGSSQQGPNGALLALTVIASVVALGAAGRLVATRSR